MTLIVSGITLISVFLSVLFFPEVKIGKVKFGSYWVISLIGAIVLLLLGSIDLKTLLEGFLKDSSVNPLKILVLFFSYYLFDIMQLL